MSNICCILYHNPYLDDLIELEGSSKANIIQTSLLATIVLYIFFSQRWSNTSHTDLRVSSWKLSVILIQSLSSHHMYCTVRQMNKHLSCGRTRQTQRPPHVSQITCSECPCTLTVHQPKGVYSHIITLFHESHHSQHCILQPRKRSMHVEGEILIIYSPKVWDQTEFF